MRLAREAREDHAYGALRLPERPKTIVLQSTIIHATPQEIMIKAMMIKMATIMIILFLMMMVMTMIVTMVMTTTKIIIAIA